MIRAVFTLLIAAAVAGANAQTTWVPDKAHSEVSFTVQYLVISKVTGKFNNFDFTLDQTTDDLSGSTLKATVDVASIDTDNEKRDNHLRSDDFLNAEKFPTLVFVSTAFEKAGENRYRVPGNLTIRNITRPVVLDVHYNGTVQDPWGNTKAGFTATTTINRFDFDVKWDKTNAVGDLVVGKDIEITLLVQAVKQAGS